MRSLILLLVIFLSSGCIQNDDSRNYQMLSINGDVYRLNQKTGEIVSFGKDGIQKYDNEYINSRFQSKSDVNDLRVESGLTFPESSGQLWMRVQYKWRNDKIMYRLSFGPYSDKLREKMTRNDNISVMFHDKDYFAVANADILLNSFARVVDENGEVAYLRSEGEVSCSKDDYELVSSINTSWSFGNELRDEIKLFSDSLKKTRLSNYIAVKDMIEKGKIRGKVENGKYYVSGPQGLEEITASNYERNEFVINYPFLYQEEINTNSSQKQQVDNGTKS